MLRLQSTATTATETSDAHKISTSAFSETTAASSTETSETVTFETRSTPVETPHRRLFLFTATIGFLDGLNPCSIWAFCILLGLLLRLGSRKRMLLVGGTYIIFSGLVYLGFLLAWLGFNLVFSFTWILRLGIGLAVVIIGVLNVKDFATSFRGPSLQIPDSQKPRLYRMMRRLAAEKTPLPLLLVGVAFLAFTLNLVELVCTAGLPATYTQVLASQNLPMRLYYLYLLEYVFFYTIDLLFLLLVFTITLTAFKVGETYGRVSKLVSGLVMLGLGLILILRPDLLAFS